MENTAKNSISKEEEKKLKEQLDELLNVERPKIIADLKVARSFGDLSENAEYASARERQAVVEDRIREIEATLKESVVVEKSKRSNVVVVGSNVDVTIKKGGKKTFTIGKKGAGIEISIHSPMAEAVLGKEVGDSITVTTPGGEKHLTINKVYK